MNKYCFVFSLFFALVACHNAATPDAAAKIDPAAIKDSIAKASIASLKKLHFDYDKDPSCGMPLRAGLEDTATYKGKLYGFCSKECKEAFQKDPAGFTAKIK